MGGSIGFIVVALITAEILAWGGKQSFPIVAAILLLPLLFAVHLLQEPRNTSTTSEVIDNEKFWRRIRRRPFVMFMLSTLMLQISFAPFYAFFALYLTQLGYAPMAVGGLIALGVAAEVLMFLVAGRTVVRYPVRYLLMFCLAITAIRWALLSQFAGSFIWLVIIQLIHAFSFALHHSAAMRFVHRYFPADQHSRGQAIYVSICFGGGGAIGAWLAGLTWQQGAGAEQTFLLAAAATLIGFFAAAWMSEQVNDRSLDRCGQ